MPSVTAIANQTRKVIEVSQKFFQPSLENKTLPNMTQGSLRNPPIYARENLANVDTSWITAGVIQTSSNLIRSDHTGRPTITNFINNYREMRENFAETLRENMKALREASEQLRDSRKDAETQENERSRNSEETQPQREDEPRTSLSTLDDFATGNVPPQEQNIANANAERIAAGITDQRNAQNESERGQSINRPIVRTNLAPRRQQDRITEFAQNYLTPENETPKGSAIARIDENDRLGMLEGLVREYNTALSYLNENRGMSNRMSALANRFSNGGDLAEALGNIGISVNEFGALSINEQRLAAALDRNSEGVNEVLGDRGLAGRLERNVNIADRQGANLFPTITEYLEEQEEQREDEAESLYTLGMFNTATYSRNNNRLFNVFT